MTNDEILNGCKRNCLKAQKALYEKFSGAMMGICIRYMGKTTEAEDVFQDGFVKVYKSIHKLEHPEALASWIKSVFVTTCINSVKRNKKIYLSQIEQFDIAADSFADDSVNKEQLLKVLDKLPGSMRMIFNLFVVEGYNHKEIATLLAITETTSKSQLSRARALLKEIIFKTENV